MLTILGSLVNMIWGGDAIEPLDEHINLHFNNGISSYEPWNLWYNWLWAQWGFANSLARIACFISYKKWVLREKNKIINKYIYNYIYIYLRHISLICKIYVFEKLIAKHSSTKMLRSSHTHVSTRESGEVWDQNSVQGGWKWSKVEGATPTSLRVLERPLTLRVAI